ncbi:hypothetical protein [Seinonella peptonophila]|uniref:hypothetical protein n=1 Tax=Seinonella peptonophila TaxID=112248 RepID=UPI00093526B5|nr:hypothetical protein [Seinonella peptonophila]
MNAVSLEGLNLPLWENHLDLSRYIPGNFMIPHTLDVEIIGTLHSVYKRMGIKPESVRRAGNVVLGENFYPAMFHNGYMHPVEGLIDQITILPQDFLYTAKLCGRGNRVYQGVAPFVWGAFDTLIYDIAGQRPGDPFYGTLDQACERTRPIMGTMFGTPKKPYELLTAILSVEEWSADKNLCLYGLRNMINTFLKPGGTIAVAMMVEPPAFRLPSGRIVPYPDFREREIVEFFKKQPLEGLTIRRIKHTVRGEKGVLLIIGQR